MEHLQICRNIVENIEKVIVGKRDAIEFLLIGVLARGHILIEDVPGVGKTTLAKALAKTINADFKRVQFTPDLLPSDLTGVSVYNQKDQEFEFKKGPIFANIILADEINRTTPRTQSGLLEAMQEFKISAEGKVYPLPDPFFVVATQNPIEFKGTYSLPESQLDRFLLKLDLGYPDQKEEENIMFRHLKGWELIEYINPVVELKDLTAAQKAVMEINIDADLLRYIAEIVLKTRSHALVKFGGSPRASIALMQASRALALVSGRDYVIPDDVKRLAPAVLSHRITVKPQAVVKGHTVKDVISDVLGSVRVIKT